MARLPNSFCCVTCGQPVGLRRARQGVKQHPDCRKRSARPPVDQAFRQTRQVLARLGETSEDEELAGLFKEAAACAGTLVKDLQELQATNEPAKRRRKR